MLIGEHIRAYKQTTLENSISIPHWREMPAVFKELINFSEHLLYFWRDLSTEGNLGQSLEMFQGGSSLRTFVKRVPWHDMQFAKLCSFVRKQS